MRRHRIRTNEQAYSGSWTLRYGNEPQYQKIHNSKQMTKLSSLDDGIHGANRPDSACSHFKFISSAPAYSVPANPLHTGIGGQTMDIIPPDGPIPIHSGHLPGIPDHILGQKFNRWTQTAFKEFTEQFNEEVSIANFIYELKDFSSAIKEAKGLFRGLFKGNGGFFRSLQSFLHGRASNGVGGNILDFELNWKSLVGDLPKIWNAYSIAMKRLEFLVGHQSFHTHKRARYMVDPSEMEEIQIFDLYDDVWPFFGFYHVFLVPSQCQVVYNASAFIDNHLQLKDINTWWAIADTLGLNNSVRIIWNAVKLSWVADMFIETEEFLDAFEVEAYSGILVNRGGTASWKVVRHYDVVCRYSGPDGPGDDTEVVVGGIMLTDYGRVVVQPIRPSLLSLESGLNSHQTYLLTSLGDAQLGITSGGYEKISRLAADFRRNKATFGRRFWKRGKR